MLGSSEFHLIHFDEPIDRRLRHTIQHIDHLVLQELGMTLASKIHQKLLVSFLVLFHLQNTFHTLSESFVKGRIHRSERIDGWRVLFILLSTW